MSAPSSPAAAREESPSPSSEAPEIKSSSSEFRDDGAEIQTSKDTHIIQATEDHTKLEHSRSPSLPFKGDTPDSPSTDAVAKVDADEHSAVATTTVKDGSPDFSAELEVVDGKTAFEQPTAPSAQVDHDPLEKPPAGAVTASDSPSPPGKASPARPSHTALDSFAHLFEDDGSEEDDNWQPQSHGPDVPQRSSKRKSRATASDDEASDDEGSGDVASDTNITPKKKKPKAVEDSPFIIDEEVPLIPRNAKPSPPSKRKRRTKQDDDQDDEEDAENNPAKKARRPPPKDEYERLARLEESRFASTPNPQLTKLNRSAFLKVKKGSAQIVDRSSHVASLAAQITSVPPSRHPDLVSKDVDKDDNGRRTKFYYEKIREPIGGKVGGRKGSRWVEGGDEGVVWLKIPASQKYLSLSGRMVPVSEIVANSPLLPEFRFVENVFTEDSKTGKQVVGFHVVTYERMGEEEKREHMKAGVAREKMRRKMEVRDEAAVRGRGRK